MRAPKRTFQTSNLLQLDWFSFIFSQIKGKKDLIKPIKGLEGLFYANGIKLSENSASIVKRAC